MCLKPGSQYVAQLRGAARGAALATICEHSTAHESRRAAPRRAARIDPSSRQCFLEHSLYQSYNVTLVTVLAVILGFLHVS